MRLDPEIVLSWVNVKPGLSWLDIDQPQPGDAVLTATMQRASRGLAHLPVVAGFPANCPHLRVTDNTVDAVPAQAQATHSPLKEATRDFCALVDPIIASTPAVQSRTEHNFGIPMTRPQFEGVEEDEGKGEPESAQPPNDKSPTQKQLPLGKHHHRNKGRKVCRLSLDRVDIRVDGRPFSGRSRCIHMRLQLLCTVADRVIFAIFCAVQLRKRQQRQGDRVQHEVALRC
jgi:hypothetical protein